MFGLAACLTLLGACATASPSLGVAPGATVIESVGDTAWFHVTEHRQDSIGGPSSLPLGPTEVNVLMSATLESRDETGAVYRVRVARVWGAVGAAESRTQFDTDGVVPQVPCVLDDVRRDIAIAGHETHLRVSNDGTHAPAAPQDMKSPIAVLTFMASISICGDDLRSGDDAAPGASWHSRQSLAGVAGSGAASDVTTTVLGRDDASIEYEQSGSAGLTGPDAAAPAASALGRPTIAAQTKTTVRTSRRDGLVLRLSGEDQAAMRLGFGDAEIRRVVRTEVVRIPKP